LAGRNVQTTTYSQYVASLRPLLMAKSHLELPKVVVVTGSSTYLQQRTCQALISLWSKFGQGQAQSIEASDLSQADFQALWSQVSLFEPQSLYLIRRVNQCRSMASWLSGIKTLESIRSNFVLECADKMTAELSKQVTKLGGVVIHCVEPSATQEFEKVAESFCKRRSLALDDAALRLVVDSMGHDLSKIENQIEILALQFADIGRTLTRMDIAASVGSLREDDVFELFELLRRNKPSGAHLMSEQFLDRGESAIALTGIFSRYGREQIERGNLKKGLNALRACALADRRLKSSRIDEAMVVSSIIESFSEA